MSDGSIEVRFPNSEDFDGHVLFYSESEATLFKVASRFNFLFGKNEIVVKSVYHSQEKSLVEVMVVDSDAFDHVEREVDLIKENF